MGFPRHDRLAFRQPRQWAHHISQPAGAAYPATRPAFDRARPENQPDATGLNFFFDFGGGIRWRAGERSAVSLGYRYFHISNAYTTSFNPGVDNNVFYVGYSFLR